MRSRDLIEAAPYDQKTARAEINQMDRITSALLTEFSRQNQLKNLPEDTRFEHFATYLAASRHVADTFDTADLVAGAGGDTGIDAIAIVINGSLVTDSELVGELVATNGYLDVTFVFVQAERSAAFDGAKIGTLELTRFRGHLSSWRGGGVHDAEVETAVPGGIPTADGRAGSVRA